MINKEEITNTLFFLYDIYYNTKDTPVNPELIFKENILNLKTKEGCKSVRVADIFAVSKKFELQSFIDFNLLNQDEITKKIKWIGEKPSVSLALDFINLVKGKNPFQWDVENLAEINPREIGERLMVESLINKYDETYDDITFDVVKPDTISADMVRKLLLKAREGQDEIVNDSVPAKSLDILDLDSEEKILLNEIKALVVSINKKQDEQIILENNFAGQISKMYNLFTNGGDFYVLMKQMLDELKIHANELNKQAATFSAIQNSLKSDFATLRNIQFNDFHFARVLYVMLREMKRTLDGNYNRDEIDERSEMLEKVIAQLTTVIKSNDAIQGRYYQDYDKRILNQ
jgi:hypothetical protein